MLEHVRGQIRRLGHLIGPLGVALFFALLGVIIAYVVTNNAKSKAIQANTATLAAQGRTLAAQTQAILALQQTQADNSATGRVILRQLLDYSDPNSPTSRAQGAKAAALLTQLDAANAARFADTLRKLGELAVTLGVPPATVNRILSQPAPMPTFSGTGAVSAGPAPSAQARPGASNIPPPAAAPASRSCPSPILHMAPLEAVDMCLSHPQGVP